MKLKYPLVPLAFVFATEAVAMGGCQSPEWIVKYLETNYQERLVAWIPTTTDDGKEPFDYMIFDTPDGAVNKSGKPSRDTWSLVGIRENAQSGLHACILEEGTDFQKTVQNLDFSISDEDYKSPEDNFVQSAWGMAVLKRPSGKKVTGQKVISIEENPKGEVRIVQVSARQGFSDSNQVVGKGPSLVWVEANPELPYRSKPESSSQPRLLLGYNPY